MASIPHPSPLTFDPAAPLAAVASLLRAVRLSGRPPASIEAKPPAPVTEPLRTERLSIRPLVGSDRSEFERVMRSSHDHLSRFCPLTKGEEHALSPGEVFSRQLELCQGGDRTGKAWRRALFTSSGRLVGAVNFNDITRGLENTGELVLWLAHDAVRMGYAAEALSAALRFAFADAPGGLGLHKIIALIAPDNAPCRRTLAKAGFEPGVGEGAVELVINTRRVPHDLWVAYAPVPPTIQPQAPAPASPLVRGLSAMLELEAHAALAAHVEPAHQALAHHAA